MTKRKCVHHYLLEPPSGKRTIRGECKKCGKVKIHRPENYLGGLSGVGAAWGLNPTTPTQTNNGARHTPAAVQLEENEQKYRGTK